MAGLSFVCLQVAISLFLVPWGQYRAEQLALQSNTNSVAKFDDFPPLTAQLKSALGTQEPHPYSVVSHLTALLGFTGSTQFDSKPVERRVYIEARSNPAWSCGALEGLGSPNDKAAAYADEALDVSCRSSKAITFWSSYIKPEHGDLPVPADGWSARSTCLLPAGAPGRSEWDSPGLRGRVLTSRLRGRSGTASPSSHLRLRCSCRPSLTLVRGSRNGASQDGPRRVLSGTPNRRSLTSASRAPRLRVNYWASRRSRRFAFTAKALGPSSMTTSLEIRHHSLSGRPASGFLDRAASRV